MQLFHKKNKYEINIETANAALQNVFSACDKVPNSIPFDKLLLREKLNTRLYDRILILLSVLLLLTFLSPLAVVPVSEFLDSRFAPEKVLLEDDYVEDGVLYIRLTGDNILFDEAYLEMPDGTVIPVLSYDKNSQTLCFPFITEAETNIYIPVKDNTPLHLLLSPE